MPLTTRLKWTFAPTALAGLLVLFAALGSPTAEHFGAALSSSLHAQEEEPGSPRARAPLTLLQINDVYSTVPVDGFGGLARIATVKRRLVEAGRSPLLLIAGDFLSPSVASSTFKGEQMVAALNAAGLDLATLGNHEFDFGPDVLLKRMAEAKWQWVISNVVDTRTGKPIGNAQPYVIKTFGPLKVGFIGLCLTSDEITEENLRSFRLISPMRAAATYLPKLKREGANVIVALTHLSYAEDRALAERFPEIDVIVGGHEHYPITATENRTLISKAGSDAKYIARIDITRRQRGAVGRYFELIPVTADIPDEPRTLEVVNVWEARLDPALDAIVATSRVDLDAESTRIRVRETNLGNLFADAMRAGVQADIAIANAGGVRGDRVYPAGPLSRRTLITMAPFGNVVCKVEARGHVILSALNSAVARLPASDGRFPQVSGMTMKVDQTAPAGNRVTDVRIGGRPIDLELVYTVAISDYQLKGGDGYGMFLGQRLLVGPESGPLVVTALEKYVSARGDVNPAIEGRVEMRR